jgi:hypothetical protein
MYRAMVAGGQAVRGLAAHGAGAGA